MCLVFNSSTHYLVGSPLGLRRTSVLRRCLAAGGTGLCPRRRRPALLTSRPQARPCVSNLVLQKNNPHHKSWITLVNPRVGLFGVGRSELDLADLGNGHCRGWEWATVGSDSSSQLSTSQNSAWTDFITNELMKNVLWRKEIQVTCFYLRVCVLDFSSALHQAAQVDAEFLSLCRGHVQK